jgi:hypothetical protein
MRAGRDDRAWCEPADDYAREGGPDSHCARPTRVLRYLVAPCQRQLSWLGEGDMRAKACRW